jgi:hypothetical protein
MAGILNKIIVKTWYNEQAGSFLVLFLVLFGAVSPGMQLAYHYSLILGMLKSPLFMALVALAWLGYAAKVDSFVDRILMGPEYLFLGQLLRLGRRRAYGYFLAVQAWLLFPVWGYALVIAGVAWHQKTPLFAVVVPLYVMLLIGLGAAGYGYRLRHPDRKAGAIPLRNGRFMPYWSILARYLLVEGKWMLVGIKLFSCVALYAMLRTQTRDDYDLRLPYFVYSLALFGHGLLLYRCRALETTKILWYRALPVPLFRRFIQIAFFCGLLLLPEMLTLGWLTPDPIRITDSCMFVFSGYSVLLWLYSLLLATSMPMDDYLKLCLVLFGILYVGVLGSFLILLSGLFFLTALVLFKRGY